MKKFELFDVVAGPIPLEIGKFPGGEIRVKVSTITESAEPIGKEVRIVAHLFNSDDVMTLVMLTDALRQMGCRKIRLTMPYIPYARQDRVCNVGEAFSIKAFARIINSLEFSSIVVDDPHSDVAVSCLDRVIVRSQADILKTNAHVRYWASQSPADAQDKVPTYLVSPDAGSLKKIYTVAKELPYFKGIIIGEKERDLATGKIIRTVVRYMPPDIANARLLVVDDICDGGRTFIELGKVLRPHCKELNLYVTHGIFSQGMEVFEPFFDNVWCNTNFKDYE